MRRHAYLAAPLLVTCGAVAAIANDSVERHHSFDASGVAQLEIEHGVGEILLVPSDGAAIEVELRLQPQRNGWFGRSPDVSGMDLQARTGADTLTLSFKEKNVASDWVVRIPSSLVELSINTGVGEVQGRLPSLAATVNVGVGSVHLEADRDAVGAIDLTAGVGDTRITGAAASDVRRAFVSSTSSGSGDGDSAILVKVGVGDVAVDLR